jgi:hypothetical protein
MDQLTFSTIHYKAVKERLRAEDPSLDEETLAGTVEGLPTCMRSSPPSSGQRWPMRRS